MNDTMEQRDILSLPDYVMPAVMLVFGYPTEQQRRRPKPVRSGLEYVVSENRYPEMDAEYVRGMLEPKSGEMDYEQIISSLEASPSHVMEDVSGR